MDLERTSRGGQHDEHVHPADRAGAPNQRRIDVYLFSNEPTSRVTVCVLDGRSDDGFELELDGWQALDAFNHPFAYARRAQPAAATTDPRRNSHARTNR